MARLEIEKILDCLKVIGPVRELKRILPLRVSFIVLYKMKQTSTLMLLLLLFTGCAQVTEPDPMNTKAIQIMKSMRNPVCRQVGSYLYCNEQ